MPLATRKKRSCMVFIYSTLYLTNPKKVIIFVMYVVHLNYFVVVRNVLLFFNFKAIFYLFLDEKDSFQPSGDSESFENEFLEVEINPALNWGLSSSNKFSLPIVESEREIGVPHFLCDNIDPDYGEVDADGRYYANNYSLENIVHNLY